LDDLTSTDVKTFLNEVTALWSVGVGLLTPVTSDTIALRYFIRHCFSLLPASYLFIHFHLSFSSDAIFLIHPAASDTQQRLPVLNKCPADNLVKTGLPDVLITHSRDSVQTASVVYWSEFLAADPEVLGSIPGATRLSENQWVWNGVHSAL
jgi:hypothetical protein